MDAAKVAPVVTAKIVQDVAAAKIVAPANARIVQDVTAAKISSKGCNKALPGTDTEQHATR